MNLPSRHDWRNWQTCQCGEPGCQSYRTAKLRQMNSTRRKQPLTAKNAGLGDPPACRKCGSGQAAWYQVEPAYFVPACMTCYDTAKYWAAVCPACEAIMLEHTPVDGRPYCPGTEPVEQRAIESPQRAIASAEPEIIDAEVVELDPPEGPVQ